LGKTISIGELRQNPTRMLREVRRGATYTITDHGEPVAEVVSRRAPRWIPIDELNVLLRELGSDDAREREMAADRAVVEMADPWDVPA
jgi:prevent-host-death family protein